MRAHRSIVALLAVLLAGCGGPPEVPWLEELASNALDAPGPQWPPPPDAARVEYLGSIGGRRGFERSSRLWSRIRALLVGRESEALVRPAGLCIRGDRLAIADPGASAVHLLDLAARSWKVLRKGPAGQSLVLPVEVACLPDGGVVVADSAGDALWRYSADGTALGTFTQESLRRPTGLALDPDRGRLWVVETLAHRVTVFGLDGRTQLRVGGRGSGLGRFNYPTLVASDGRGGVWLTDALNFRLHHITAHGLADRQFGEAGDRIGSLARPRGVAVDAAGRIFLVDALFDAVQIFDPAGQLLLAFGGRGQAPGRFWLPADVELDGRGHLFVADSYNRRIQVFAYRPPAPGRDDR
ncbi:MAG: 6-bladed beta-propeller [Deltaproteobacteria bacterium]|nr:6-bladed beta-propeller [Deltaproteobacteria bacterium]